MPAAPSSTFYDPNGASLPGNMIRVYGSTSGFSPRIRSKAEQVDLGATGTGPGNSVWIYVKATAAIAAGATMAAPVDVAVNTTTMAAAAGTGFKAYAPFAINEYGWVKKTAAFIT